MIYPFFHEDKKLEKGNSNDFFWVFDFGISVLDVKLFFNKLRPKILLRNSEFLKVSLIR